MRARGKRPLPLHVRLVRAVLTALLGLALLCAPAGADPVAGSSGYVELPVTFRVKNSNRTAVPCVSDNQPYDVKGHLIGPRSALDGSQARAVTLYLYGFETGEFNWRFTAVNGYNWPAEMVKAGHVSLTIDMLGYDSSGHPHGFMSCFGSQADVTHQIIEKLRKGGDAYRVTGTATAPSFAKVVLAGHDVGGGFAEIEAYTYKDVDALILLSWADEPPTPTVLGLATEASARCALGGEQAEPGGPGGYVFLAGPDDQRAAEIAFHNADPAVIREASSLRNRNPCAYLSSLPTAIMVDRARVGEITVPVLLVFPDHDVAFTPDQGERQRNLLTGSSDKRMVVIENTGHFPMWERTAPTSRAVVSNWLCERDLVAVPCKLGAENGALEGGGGGFVGGLP